MAELASFSESSRQSALSASSFARSNSRTAGRLLRVLVKPTSLSNAAVLAGAGLAAVRGHESTAVVASFQLRSVVPQPR
jgi:hypothetical protein